MFPIAGIYGRPLYPQNLIADVAEGRKKKWGFSKLQDRASGLSCEIVGLLLLAEKIHLACMFTTALPKVGNISYRIRKSVSLAL